MNPTAATVVVAALLAGGAAALLLRPRAGLPEALGVGSLAPPPSPHRARRPQETESEDLVDRHRLAVSLLAGLGPVLLVGGGIGFAGGLATAVGVHRALTRREPSGERRRRARVVRGLPHVVDLLSVVMAAGAAPATAVTVVAAAVEGPVADELLVVRHALAVGRDPARVWREVARRPGLEALGRTMTRAVESGASVSDALHRLAEDLRATARTEAEGRARTVGVRAAIPLGLCLLPAFVLVGVVPLVAGTVGSLLAR